VEEGCEEVDEVGEEGAGGGLWGSWRGWEWEGHFFGCGEGAARAMGFFLGGGVGWLGGWGARGGFGLVRIR